MDNRTGDMGKKSDDKGIFVFHYLLFLMQGLWSFPARLTDCSREARELCRLGLACGELKGGWLAPLCSAAVESGGELHKRTQKFSEVSEMIKVFFGTANQTLLGSALSPKPLRCTGLQPAIPFLFRSSAPPGGRVGGPCFIQLSTVSGSTL